ncbi:unnamed protein product [Nesidiocoris tenuis]|uniref:Uncharacterized protein n=1 Tax=Nesidiocoris tenuis TaxID=355587 RepID=A0A6H5G538_9HEMI|nr:unnamed protein product [Nesidiocoris tenuis]
MKVINNRLNCEFNGIKRSAALKRWIVQADFEKSNSIILPLDSQQYLHSTNILQSKLLHYLMNHMALEDPIAYSPLSSSTEEDLFPTPVLSNFNRKRSSQKRKLQEDDHEMNTLNAALESKWKYWNRPKIENSLITITTPFSHPKQHHSGGKNGFRFSCVFLNGYDVPKGLPQFNGSSAIYQTGA